MGWKNGAYQPHEFNGQEIELLAGKVARKYIVAFEKYPDVHIEDLIAEIVSAVWQAWPRYDYQRGEPSTFVNNVSRNYIISQLRTRGYKKNQPGAPLHENMADVDAPDDGELREFVERIYAHSNTLVKARQIDPWATRNPGLKRKYSIPLAITLMALRAKLKLSYRAMQHWLIEHPEICAIVGLDFAPPWWVFARFYRSVARLAPELKLAA